MRIAVPGATMLALLSLGATAGAQSTPPPPWAVGPASPPEATPGAAPSATQPPSAPATPGSAAAPGTTSVPSAQPAPTGADTIVLRDGSELHGTAVDVRPGQTLTLRVASGELRVIAWSDISSGSGPGLRAAASAPATATTSAVVPSGPAAAARRPSADDDDDDVAAAPSVMFRASNLRRPRPGTFPVRLESDGDPLSIGVVVPISVPTSPYLYNPAGSYSSLGGGFSGGMGFGTSYGGFGGLGATGYPSSSYGSYGYGMAVTTYQSVCTTPCTIYLRPGAHTFHVGGTGRRESDETIQVDGGSTRVRFRSASRTAHALGQTFLWIGVGAAVLGVLLFVNENSRCGGISGCDVTLPLGLMIGGGLAVGIGAPLILVNATGVAERSSTPSRAAASRVRLGAGPLPGGGFAGLSAAF